MSLPRAPRVRWSRGGHEVVVVSQERAPDAVRLGGAQALPPIFRVGCCPCSSWIGRGARAEVPPELQRGRATRVRRSERGCARACCGRSVFTNHVLMGGPVGAASGAPSRQGTRLELEYSMRGRPELGEWARETLRARTRPTLAPSTFAKCSQTWLGHN